MVKIQGGKEFVAIASSDAENNSIFLDTSDDKLKQKDNDGSVKSFGCELGEVKMFALSMTGAVTKASLIIKGWAICDGTTPAVQGITSPTIDTTPNLQEKFLRMSDDETSGGTGGKDAVKWVDYQTTYDGENYIATHYEGSSANGNKLYDSSGALVSISNSSYLSQIGYTETNIPAYYEVAYFMKVK